MVQMQMAEQHQRRPVVVRRGTQHPAARVEEDRLPPGPDQIAGAVPAEIPQRRVHAGHRAARTEHRQFQIRPRHVVSSVYPASRSHAEKPRGLAVKWMRALPPSSPTTLA